MLLLNESNYFSKEADQHYMSASQFKTFLDCPARAMAQMRGEWRMVPSTAMLIGSYIDAHFSSSLALFKGQHPDIFKRDGSLKAEFENANQIINRIESDKVMMEYLTGQSQTVFTGTISGVPFKGKTDVYVPGVRIVDLKIMRDFATIWDPIDMCRKHWIDAWNYPIQAAIYQALEGGSLPFYIAAATKETQPDIALLEIPQEVIDAKLEMIEVLAPEYQAIKLGLDPPTRCERCDYCKATRVLTGPIDYREEIA